MDIGENINVIASFGMPYKIRPLKFRWAGRLFEVKEITYLWKSRERAAEIYHFSVSDGRALYELTFNTDSLVWRLEQLEA